MTTIITMKMKINKKNMTDDQKQKMEEYQKKYREAKN